MVEIPKFDVGAEFLKYLGENISDFKAEDLESQVDVDAVLLKPKKWVPGELWSQIFDWALDMNGEWVKNGTRWKRPQPLYIDNRGNSYWLFDLESVLDALKYDVSEEDAEKDKTWWQELPEERRVELRTADWDKLNGDYRAGHVHFLRLEAEFAELQKP